MADKTLGSGDIDYPMNFYDWRFRWEGDTHLSEDLFGDWVSNTIENNGNEEIKKTNVVIVVIGNLIVEGTVNAIFRVTGNMKCDFYENCSEEVGWVEGHADIKYVMTTQYDGLTSFGSLNVPFIIRDSDHSIDYGCRDAITIQLTEIASWEEGNEMIESGDYNQHLRDEVYYIDEEEDEREVFYGVFGQLVKSGESPFKPSSKYHPSNARNPQD